MKNVLFYKRDLFIDNGILWRKRIGPPLRRHINLTDRVGGLSSPWEDLNEKIILIDVNYTNFRLEGLWNPKYSFVAILPTRISS